MIVKAFPAFTRIVFKFFADFFAVAAALPSVGLRIVGGGWSLPSLFPTAFVKITEKSQKPPTPLDKFSLFMV
jgi:hypothetical protein